jgi:flagellar M-ring protein FliF
MGFLNQSIAQIRDLFASMTPAARITATLLLAVIGVSLAYLFQGYTGGGKEYLFNGEMLPPRDVDRMLAAIGKAGLSDYETEGSRISVPRGKKSQYMAAIADGGALPANFDTLLLDELDNLSMFGDSKTRDARMKAARELQLSMLVRDMDGIETAKVLFEIRQEKGFARPKTTATVSVRPAPGEDLTLQRAKMIRLAIAQAIGGAPGDVAILNQRDGSLAGGSSELGADAFDEPYFQAKTTYEQVMKAKIEDVLRDIPGVRVQVTADLDESLGSETRILKVEGDPQTVSEETDQSLEKTTQVEDRGRPGLVVQGPAGTPPDEAVAKNEQTNETNTRTAQSWVPTNEEVKQLPGLVPKHVRAAIAIPSEFLARVWREKNPDAPADQRPTEDNIQQLAGLYEDNIKALVTPLLPREPTEDVYPNVQVTVFQSLTPEPVEEPSTLSQLLLWASRNSGTLIMAGLALVSLVMLRSTMKSIPALETNVILQTPAAAAALGGGEAATAVGGVQGAGDVGAGGEVAPGGKPRPKLRLKKGPSLKDDLTEMVREDPDAAAAILRTWISTAG